MFKKLSIGCLLIVLLGVGIGVYFISGFPSEIHAVATRTINAPSEEIHPLIEDFHRWPEWSFWHEADPSLTYEYSGSEKGEGAIVRWKGKDGPGGMTATSSDPTKGFWYDLTFGEPGQEMGSKGIVAYEAVEGGTLVTFEMRGDLEGLLGKLMGKIMTPMVEEAFTVNLDNIAKLTEKK